MVRLFKKSVLLLSVIAAVITPAAAINRAFDSEPPSCKYTLLADGDGVAVICGTKRIASADVELFSLRAADRDMLERGISVSTKDEALRLLEDFSS